MTMPGAIAVIASSHYVGGRVISAVLSFFQVLARASELPRM